MRKSMRTVRRAVVCVWLLGAVPAQVDWNAKWMVQNRAYHAMAGDTARHRLVLFGGEANGQVLGDTWEWDGTDWVQMFPATSPGPRQQHTMTYDGARGVVVLFGGIDTTGTWLNDTWEWNGVTWTQVGMGGVNPPASPSPFTPYRLTFDALRGRIVTVHTDEIWEWDGNTWTKAPVTMPSILWGSMIAYDSARGVSVIIAIDSFFNYVTFTWDGNQLAAKQAAAPFPDMLIDDPAVGRVLCYETGPQAVYEWNGTSWTRRFPATVPSGRSGIGWAYDEVTQRILLVGGETGPGEAMFDSWEWDGVTWSKKVPFPSPVDRYGHGMAYDRERDFVVLFGGIGVGGVRADTWEWDGMAWNQRTPGIAPSARETSMTEDGQHVLLFGGAIGATELGDTWRWDGTSWQQMFPAASPPGRAFQGMAYDRERNRIVLYGGVRIGTTFGDTWEWDGSNWQQMSPATSPPPLFGAGLAYDAERRVVVLFGGMGSTESNQTWEWDGHNWTQRFPPISPPARYLMGFAYDAARGRMVLFGGESTVQPWFGDTWEWDGNTWTQRLSPQVPRPQRRVPLVYEPAQRSLLMFGGSGQNFITQDTWHYAPTDPATFATSQSGCPGTAGTPTLTTITPRNLPWLGDPFTITVTNIAPGHAAAMAAGFSNTEWAGIPLPLALSFIGMFGCQALCSAQLFFPLPPADPSGTTTWTLGPIPNDPGFLGFTFFTQAWVADSSNPAGLITSNLGQAIVGGK